jgi:hypothetical protein
MSTTAMRMTLWQTSSRRRISFLFLKDVWIWEASEQRWQLRPKLVKKKNAHPFPLVRMSTTAMRRTLWQTSSWRRIKFLFLKDVWIWEASELPWKPKLVLKNKFSFCWGCLLQRWGEPCGKQVQEEEFNFYSWKMSGFEKPASCHDNSDPNLRGKKRKKKKKKKLAHPFPFA